jgi:hypothetical protein
MKRTILAVTLAAAGTPVERVAATPELAARYGRLPQSFEANLGQTAPEVRFVSRGPGYTLFLTPSEAVTTLRSAGGSAIVRMRFAGARTAPAMEGLDQLPGKIHYARGHDRGGRRTNIPSYAKVAYRAAYPGIDVVFHGDQGRLEYDFLVAPGAEPRAIRLAFDGVDALRLDGGGHLILTTPAGEIVQQAPFAYQHHGAERRRVPARYGLEGGREVRIDVAEYDRRKPLVIDPVLMYSTFLGGSGMDLARGIAADRFGNAYVTGATASLDFPSTVPAVPLGWDTFVTKLDANGQNFVYSTFIAGSWASAIAVDADGRAYVTGSADAGLPWTAGAFQTTFGGGTADAFVARLDASGALDWATFLGGGRYDYAIGIAVDSDGISSVTGLTQSADFPTQSPFQAAYAGGWNDGFVSRLDPNGSALLWSSYLGGGGFDAGWGVAVDPGNNAFVAGYASAGVAPDSGPGCTTQGLDVVVAKVDPAGALAYLACVGGSSAEYGRAIAVDATGHAFVTGDTVSTDFPMVSPLQGTKSGLSDGFVFRLDPAGSSLVYSTYLGGSNDEYAYVAGVTYSKDFPVLSSLQGFGGNSLADAFLVKLRPQGSGLVYSTFLGGADDEDSGGFGTFVTVVRDVALLAGNTKSKDFPLASAMLPSPAQPAHASPGVLDAWVARVQ